MPIDHDRIEKNGWRQGSVFTVYDSRALLSEYTWRPQPTEIPLPPDSRLIVVSHSCDLVSKRPHELQVEVCPAYPLPSGETRESYGFARDARRLRIPLMVGGSVTMFDLHAPLRFAIERTKLEVLKPDLNATITEEDLDDYSVWLAARVRRRVFPNAFDNRFDTANNKRIRKAIKRIHKHVYALLYSISSMDELDEQTPYRLRVVILAKPDAFQVSEVRTELETVRDQIESILGNRPGIVLEQISVSSAARMTFEQYRTFSSWGFEDVSLEEDSELPPY